MQGQEAGGGDGEEGAETAAAAAVRVHDKERDRSPRGRLQMEEVWPESCQEQPFPKVDCIASFIDELECATLLVLY